jgi:hypothetical protein
VKRDGAADWVSQLQIYAGWADYYDRKPIYDKKAG